LLFYWYTNIPVYAKAERFDRGDFMPKPQAIDTVTSNFSDEFSLPEIASSWQRSQQAGVDPHKKLHSSFPAERAKSVADYAELIDIAVAAMNDIYKSVKGSGFHVVLTDEEGWVIESIPPLKPISLNNWSEEFLGTNALGTSIQMQKAIQITGSEHFHHDLAIYTTSAVPIFDHHGALSLVLGLIGPSYEDHSRVLSMLHKVVKIIVNKWQVAEQDKQLSVYSRRLKDIFNLMADGVIIVTNAGEIEDLNQSAVKILGKKARGYSSVTLKKLFEGKACFDLMLNAGIPFNDVELLLDCPTGRVHCLASGQPSHDDKGSITGGIIVLHSIDRVHRLVNSVCGTRAELNFDDIIGLSHPIKETVKLARVAASTMSNMMLQGESGTGKEIFAQAIHNHSPRCQGPFVAINCGAIPRELIGSELFGYVDGAFTGARRGGKAGKFEMAAGGTLFLDEIGDMPLDQQVVLLRVLQDKMVTRIGDSKNIPVDVRIICASNKDLLEEVENGNFRQDLYYRLNVICITIPPLRDRKDDIALLMQHYLMKLGVAPIIMERIMNPAVMHCLARYNWPGNVRELQNVAERLAIIADTQPITPSDLPPEICTLRHTPPLNTGHSLSDSEAQLTYAQKKKRLIAEKEAELIIDLLEKHRGNLTEVAKAMGFSRTTLYRKLELYHISKAHR
jgi:transcriptional regulator of acetoin/glycerol metabolism